MKKFDNLTREEYSEIVNERINTILEISNDLLQKFIPLSAIKPYYFEHPPILSDKSHLKSCLVGTGGDKLGTLQRFYLMSYIVDAEIRFRAKDNETSVMWVIFDRNPNWGPLNNENPVFTIDGNNGFRGTYLIKIVSANGLHFPLAPSLSIKIEKDGEQITNQSITSLISSMQPNSQVALLNFEVCDFKQLRIEIINNNPDINFDCGIAFI